MRTYLNKEGCHMPRGDGTGPWHQGRGFGGMGGMGCRFGFGGMGRGWGGPEGFGRGCWRRPDTVPLLEGRILYLEEELKELRARRDALGEGAGSR